jgi:hypothetical protein
VAAYADLDRGYAWELLERSGLPFEVQVIDCTVAAYADLDRGYAWDYPCLYHPGLYKGGLEKIEEYVREYVPFVKT